MQQLSPAAKRLCGVALLLSVLTALAFGASASAATTVTIGNTFPSLVCGGPAFVVQTANSAYVVPAGDWRITAWSTQAGPGGGSMSLMIFRPTATPGTYLVVGESPVESLTANTLNTFTLTSPFAVQPGDLLGMWEGIGVNCAVFGGGVVQYNFGAEPPAGATVTLGFSQGLHLNISATLSPALPTTKADCMQGGWQSFFGAFKNQGDCVSFIATDGKNPPG